MTVDLLRLKHGQPIYIDYTPGTAKSAGSVVVLEDSVGIVHNRIEASTLGALALGGGVYLGTGDAAISQGVAVYWDATNGKATETVAGNKFLGLCVRECSGDGEDIWVLHLPGKPGDQKALGTPTFTVGSESGNVINVAVQLNDRDGNALAQRANVYAYLSDDANGDSITATAPDGGVAIGTDGVLDAVTADKSFRLTSESDGDIDIDITESGAATWYLVVVLPDGTLAVSDAITFA